MNGYAQVNGLEMYYETHGSGRPLVLLHGGISGIGSSFGGILPLLAKNRQVIAVELQGHGRTADIDRPLRIEHLADDVIALLRQLGVESADLFGYSLGAVVALEVALREPGLVGKLVVASLSHSVAGLHPGVLDGMDMLTPEMLVGTPFEEEYLRIAPDPEHWPELLEKIKEFDREWIGWPAERVRSNTVPTLVVVGDSDIVTPEHAVETFRMFGGGVMGDGPAGLPASQLAILPGTSHMGMANRGEWLAPMIEAFLDR
jgi:pimeloyl-ACP methyl ester carboxylesterase